MALASSWGHESTPRKPFTIEQLDSSCIYWDPSTTRVLWPGSWWEIQCQAQPQSCILTMCILSAFSDECCAQYDTDRESKPSWGTQGGCTNYRPFLFMTFIILILKWCSPSWVLLSFKISSPQWKGLRDFDSSLSVLFCKIIFIGHHANVPLHTKSFQMLLFENDFVVPQSQQRWKQRFHDALKKATPTP